MLWLVISDRYPVLSLLVFNSDQSGASMISLSPSPHLEVGREGGRATLTAGLVNTELVVWLLCLSVSPINIAITMIFSPQRWERPHRTGEGWGLEVILDNKLDTTSLTGSLWSCCEGHQAGLECYSLTFYWEQSHKYSSLGQTNWKLSSENIKGGGDWRSGVTILLPLYHCLPRVEEFQIHKFSVRSYNFRLGGESN